MSIKKIFEIFFEELLLGDKLQKEKQLQEYFEIYDVTREMIVNKLLMSKKQNLRDLGRVLLNNVDYMFKNSKFFKPVRKQKNQFLCNSRIWSQSRIF